MLCRVILKSIRKLAICSSLVATTASAQAESKKSVFFDFDFVLFPIAIKWFCGGQTDQDLSQIAALTAAFPEDAEDAELQSLVDELLQMSERETGLTEILSAEFSDEQVDKLCAAARPLSLSWATPEQMVDGGEDGVPLAQRVVWEAFYQVIEELQ